ncbi:conjugal transfer protein TraG [Clostridia bacterium]|nr:conjugal transfer protein TraG [Clostridia bacterium]
MKSERFNTASEIERVLCTCDEKKGGGIVMHTQNGTNYVYTKEGHQLFLGVSGSGKSSCGTIPQTRNLIEARENIVCIDPKGEIFNKNACYAKDSHCITVINFRDPSHSSRWNPLTFVWELFHQGQIGLAQQMVQEIVFNLTAENGSHTDRFWIDSERNLISGIINLLAQYAKKEQCNFTEILNILTQDWNSLNQSSEVVDSGYLSKVVETLPAMSPIRQLLASYTNLTAKTTRSCVLSEVTNTISKFCMTEDIVEMTSGDDLSIANIDVAKPFFISIIIPDESEIYNVLSGLLISQLSHRLIKLADHKYGGKLPIRVNFILEELGNIGHAVSDLPFLMSASRSRNIRMTLVLQALSQLRTIYGESKSETILSNADIWISFRTSDWNTLNELARKCGEKTVHSGEIRFIQPLISEAQLMSMETGQALFFISGRIKYIEQLPFYSEMYDCSELYELPIPAVIKSGNYRPINLSELKNRIATGNKPNASGSYYKNKLFKGVIDND